MDDPPNRCRVFWTQCAHGDQMSSYANRHIDLTNRSGALMVMLSIKKCLQLKLGCSWCCRQVRRVADGLEDV